MKVDRFESKLFEKIKNQEKLEFDELMLIERLLRLADFENKILLKPSFT